MRREVRDDQHGTRTGYKYGCRCTACLGAERLYNRSRKRAGRDTTWVRMWQKENWDYYLAQRRNRESELQSGSLGDAKKNYARWEPSEDALLGRIASDVAAASALGRTFYAVKDRRKRLRAQGLLA